MLPLTFHEIIKFFFFLSVYLLALLLPAQFSTHTKGPVYSFIFLAIIASPGCSLPLLLFLHLCYPRCSIPFPLLSSPFWHFQAGVSLFKPVRLCLLMDRTFSPSSVLMRCDIQKLLHYTKTNKEMPSSWVQGISQSINICISLDERYQLYKVLLLIKAHRESSVRQTQLMMCLAFCLGTPPSFTWVSWNTGFLLSPRNLAEFEGV